MKRKTILASVCVILFLLISGWKSSINFSDDQASDLIKVPAGFPNIKFPNDNSFSLARWELGKKLFYDPILSLDGSISCASCHNPKFAFSDSVSLSNGVIQRAGVRNTPTLTNVAYQPYFLKEGSVPSLEMQVLVPIQEENEFAHNIVDIANKLLTDTTYVIMSILAYNRPPDAFIITHAIATFERTLISGNSPYDKFINQKNSTALTDQQQKGMQLFFSNRVNCTACHSGFNFTNYAFENNGLDTMYSDIGRMRFTKKESDKGLFKVPTLRNVAITGPYMHDGSIATLKEVISHYNDGGFDYDNKSKLIVPLNLSPNEQADLVAFLESLTDTIFIKNINFAKDSESLKHK